MVNLLVTITRDGHPPVQSIYYSIRTSILWAVVDFIENLPPEVPLRYVHIEPYLEKGD